LACHGYRGSQHRGTAASGSGREGKMVLQNESFVAERKKREKVNKCIKKKIVDHGHSLA
jgi:hypothetical protein